jgi:hypothetical protein
MNSIKNFLDSIHKAHLDNAQRVYVAKTIGRDPSERDVSPVTNFVFEFFLYNSLYAVDWTASYTEERLVNHDRDSNITESNMQNALESFCRRRCRDEHSNLLVEAFLPLAGLDDLSGAWTHITPDDRLKAEDGETFFERLANLGQFAANNDLQPTGRTFDLIRNCRFFVYRVRNNIFHGSKSLGEIYEADQARRIGVYDLFLRCLNSLFFLATGRKKHGAGFCQLPIVQRWGTSQIELSLQKVYRLLGEKQLEPEDSMLHWKLFRSNEDAPHLSSNDRRALFYPSAGDDIFFPLLVGLPFCTDFFFYDKVRRPRVQRRLRSAINELAPRSLRRAVDVVDGEPLEFEFDSVSRRAWIVHEDNMTFLEKDIPLAFYFHRGDSPGEAGSGQSWDSDLLPQLLAKSVSDIGCHVLTDGEPGGLRDEVTTQCQKVSLPNSHRNRDYFYGLIKKAVDVDQPPPDVPDDLERQ